MPLDLKRIKAICFDIDGTLADSDDVMVEQMEAVLSVPLFIFPRQRRMQFARKLIMASETPGNQLLKLLDAIGCDDWFFRLRNSLLPAYKRKIPHWKPIGGVQETLPKLAKVYSIALISARDDHHTQTFIEQLAFSAIIRCWASAETTRHTKPYPDPIQWVAKQLGVSPSQCLMVGDTPVDIQAGKNAGAQTVGVLSGFGEECELRAAGADAVIRDINELDSLLRVVPPH
ncbi:MAG: hypothetical protein DDG59_14125 [Anaerolineae bacterium]|jgi:phosphoglycolate phosphatase-like HAD superfamily hydrolase|nr:MAG: hypothetical protein DDG59_14125 [Anaerolineae bacterium]